MRAEQAAQRRPDLTHAARLGFALASPAGAGNTEKIEESLGALERWGDRRLLAFARAEVDTLRGSRGWVLRPVRIELRPGAERSRERALVDAALALKAEDEWPVGWAGAMRAVQAAVPFDRAALVSATGLGWEVKDACLHPSRLASADRAHAVARRAEGAALFEVRGAMPGLASDEGCLAVVAPVAKGTVLYLEREARAGQDGLDVVAGLARLLAAHLPEPAPAGVEIEAPAIAGLVGRSEPMRALFLDVSRAASSETTVHIFGETGTGKERIARAIHDLSPRARGPFVAVNAAAFGEELFESQLFGHVRGAFTGAVSDSIGYVGEAEGGTLFLDEVADLSPASQARLLRFLQEREYRRLGEQRVRKANLRVLTAANVLLEDLVLAGRFRKDLRFRIDAVTLVAPPLRMRGDDILLLARHFLQRLAGRDKVAVPRLSAEAASALRSYSWPGNVRELQNEMERLVVLVRDRAVGREDLRAPVAAVKVAPGPRALSQARLAVERDVVAAALQRHEGSRTRAAAELGITRQALYEKIRRLGLRNLAPTAP